MSSFFFFNDTATTEIYTLSLHDALPISAASSSSYATCTCCRPCRPPEVSLRNQPRSPGWPPASPGTARSSSPAPRRSEEHTSELQSRQYLVCRLLLEKKKK